MGEILSVASFVATPIGAVLAVAAVAAAFFMGGGSSQIEERQAPNGSGGYCSERRRRSKDAARRHGARWLFCGSAFDRGCGHVFGLLMRVMTPVGPDVVR